jgi:hypothetical protein
MSTIETKTTQIAQEALAEIQVWENAFKQTRRRNGSIVAAGHVRNTIDTANIAGQIVTVQHDRGLDIIFGSEDAEYAISLDSDRPEYADIVVDYLVDKAAPLLIEDTMRKLGFKVRS